MAVPLQPQPDARLVGLASAPQRVKPNSIDRLYKEHSRYVAYFAAKLLGYHDEVDDVVQEVFFIASQSLDASKDELQIKRWLATITIRRAARRLRWRRLRAAFFSQPDSTDLDVSPDASPETRALVQQLLTLLNHVSASDRIAWTLKHVEGEPLEAVAQLCECSLATVKRRITRAQLVLEKALR